MILPPPRSPLFPYTTLFRSPPRLHPLHLGIERRPAHAAPLRGGLLRADLQAPVRPALTSEVQTLRLHAFRHLLGSIQLEKKKKKQRQSNHYTKQNIQSIAVH